MLDSVHLDVCHFASSLSLGAWSLHVMVTRFGRRFELLAYTERLVIANRVTDYVVNMS